MFFESVKFFERERAENLHTEIIDFHLKTALPLLNKGNYSGSQITDITCDFLSS